MYNEFMGHMRILVTFDILGHDISGEYNSEVHFPHRISIPPLRVVKLIIKFIDLRKHLEHEHPQTYIPNFPGHMRHIGKCRAGSSRQVLYMRCWNAWDLMSCFGGVELVARWELPC